jgi:hypothetical protein
LAVTTVAISILGFIGVAEVVLQFLPVSSSMMVVPVNANQPIYHFTPNRQFVASLGWDFHLARVGKVNNAGWVNDQDYRREESSSLIAVIGDSYVEAATVPYAEALHGRLAASLQGKSRVYSFGASGAPLSQYLMWGRHAVQAYGATALIINVVSNDFDESHDAFKNYFHGFWIYVPRPDGELHLQLFDFRSGTLRSLAKYSALARYLIINLHLDHYVRNWRALFDVANAEKGEHLRTYQGTPDPARVAASLAVMDAFFRDLPALVGLPPERIAFVLDGFRYPDEARRGKGSYFDLMRRVFQEKGQINGYEVIDLDPLFFAHFEKFGRRFEDPRDHHWNSLGHSIAADAVLNSQLLSRLGGTQGALTKPRAN